MPRTIWRYKLPCRKDQKITLILPRNAKVLICSTQDDEDFMWCEVNTVIDVEHRDFLVIGDGEPLPDNISYRHLMTWQHHFQMWHLYEEV